MIRQLADTISEKLTAKRLPSSQPASAGRSFEHDQSDRGIFFSPLAQAMPPSGSFGDVLSRAIRPRCLRRSTKRYGAVRKIGMVPNMTRSSGETFIGVLTAAFKEFHGRGNDHSGERRQTGDVPVN
jgi:hypothetical protein